MISENTTIGVSIIGRLRHTWSNLVLLLEDAREGLAGLVGLHLDPKSAVMILVPVKPDGSMAFANRQHGTTAPARPLGRSPI